MKYLFSKEPMAGDIFFSSQVSPGFYSSAVMYFTRSKWSHCFYLSINYLGERVVYESDLKAQLVPFAKEYIEKQVDGYSCYRPILATQPQILQSCRSSFLLFSGETYGFLSIPWFAIKETCKRYFKIKMLKNWISGGAICSELLVIYIKGLGGEYAKAFGDLSADETSPADIYEIVISRPDLFEFIGERT